MESCLWLLLRSDFALLQSSCPHVHESTSNQKNLDWFGNFVIIGYFSQKESSFTYPSGCSLPLYGWVGFDSSHQVIGTRRRLI